MNVKERSLLLEAVLKALVGEDYLTSDEIIKGFPKNVRELMEDYKRKSSNQDIEDKVDYIIENYLDDGSMLDKMPDEALICLRNRIDQLCEMADCD